ncbi:UDP-N-acetylglucosamine 2-epimerase [Cytobacillus oceanisediminis]|uniref:UDP-N-acetylglucosamine 2-epimerase n=1 Tax=Cytobacillus oceanisediminis TaxID=665099 RepID=UPI001D159753|nr:UDP-N-acetylglucosamine 2-epimerase [Cytobacillus oceanisediminis]
MNKEIKKIVVVTGTRADYGIYTPLLKEIQQHQSFELGLLVTGMHLSPAYGYTINEIKKDGHNIIGTVEILIQGDSHGNMARSIGLGILGMTQALEGYKPELIFVLGDRGEMLAATIAGAFLNIPVAHLHGGELSGSIDESVRHAITKLAHIHFAATKRSAQRLVMLGEEEWRINRVGALRLDTIFNTHLPSLQEVGQKHNIEFLKDKNYFLLVFHPVTTEKNSLKQQIKNVLQVLLKQKKPIICILPNSDAGTEEIMSIYSSYKSMNIKYIINFNHLDYLTVLKHSIALIGNSSSGIIEAASFFIPVLNIGSRQNGREKGLNVVDSEPNIHSIERGLIKINDPNFQNQINKMKNLYGDGNASKRIIEVLEKMEFTKKLLDKRMTY